MRASWGLLSQDAGGPSLPSADRSGVCGHRAQNGSTEPFEGRLGPQPQGADGPSEPYEIRSGSVVAGRGRALRARWGPFGIRWRMAQTGPHNPISAVRVPLLHAADGPSRTPTRPPRDPRELRQGPKGTPRGPQERPRPPKELQENPKTPQRTLRGHRGPRWPKRASRGHQEASKTAPRPPKIARCCPRCSIICAYSELKRAR